jgi:hypothetical protein
MQQRDYEIAALRTELLRHSRGRGFGFGALLLEEKSFVGTRCFAIYVLQLL